MKHIIRLWALLTLILHGLAYWLPEDIFWSVWPYTILPRWVGFPLLAITGLLVIPQCNQWVVNKLKQLWGTIPIKNNKRWYFVGGAVLAVPLFWLLRIQHLGWGDANILVIGLGMIDAPVLYNWQAPFTVFLHQRLWALLFNPLWGWGVDDVYALVSVLCGGVFVFVLFNVADYVGRTKLEKGVIVGIVATSGAMQLFFGYVENYTLIAVGVLILVWVGLQAINNELPLGAVALALALTNGFHPSTVVLWPGVLYVAWCQKKAGRGNLNLLLELILPPLIVSSSILLLMELGNHGLAAFLGDDRPGGGDHIWFVPLVLETPNQWQHYAMFSIGHVLDWLNELFLTSPFGIVLVLLGVGSAWLNKTSLYKTAVETKQFWFLLILSSCYLGLTWVWNADYGIRKDWDLFSIPAFIYSVLAGWVLIRLFDNDEDLAEMGTLVVGVSGLHLVTWVLMNVWGII